MPAAIAASTNYRAAGNIGSRTETPRGPVVLCAAASMTISSLAAKPSLLRKYGSTSCVAPADCAARRPGIKVAGMAAHIHHVVDARRTAEHLAVRNWHAPSLEPQPGFAGIG